MVFVKVNAIVVISVLASTVAAIQVSAASVMAQNRFLRAMGRLW